MPKVLITGSAGLLGSSCMDLMRKKGWDVIGIDNNNRAKTLGTPEKKLKKGEIDLDFTRAQDLFNLFREHDFNAIIHAGGQPSHDWSNDHVIEDFMINGLGTVLLLEATRIYCPRAIFVQISTDKVYGENMDMGEMDELITRFSPLVQTRIPGFDEKLGLDFAGHRSPFGVSKTTGDLYAQEYAASFGIRTGIFRPGCITGKNHAGAELHGFLAYLAHCIKEGKEYKIFGYNGKQVRDQIHADDLASAIWHFIDSPRQGEVFNIGGGPERSVSVLEAIALLEKATGKKAKTSLHPARPGDRIWDVHDVSKFRKHYTSWDYRYTLQDIIDDLV